MGTLRFHVAVSLDRYVAGPHQSVEDPLGVGGEELHRWLFDLEVWRASEGEEGGEVNASTAVIDEAQANIGAVVMGRARPGAARRRRRGRPAYVRSRRPASPT